MDGDRQDLFDLSSRWSRNGTKAKEYLKSYYLYDIIQYEVSSR